jgi:hypothetical protein
MLDSGKKNTLGGLELTHEVILSTESANQQQARQLAGENLAAALLGGPLEWVEGPEGPAVVNGATGELIEDRSAAFAALLAFAAEEGNHVAGILDDGHGGTFHGGAALWKSSLRLDPNWIATMRRRSRGMAFHAMRRMMDGLTKAERLARHYGWRQRLTLKLITLTMPHLAGTSSLDETRRINRGLALLKKRAVWAENMAGGIKGVEDALDFDGPHVHAHLLMLSGFIDRPQLVEAWRECLDLATWEVYGYGLAEASPVVVDIRAVKKKPNGKPGLVSWEEALNEVTKYVTKPSDFLARDESGRQIPREILLELCEVRRWPRMFELLGRCRGQKRGTEAQERPDAAQAALVLIHRAYLTGAPLVIPKEVGWELVEAWEVGKDGPLELQKSIVQALKERDRAGPKRIRPPSWRDLLDTIGLSEWLSIMADRVRRGQKFRIGMILDANPSAYLVGFDGKVYGTAPAF